MSIQEQQLIDFVEARRRANRLSVMPNTDILEEIKMAKIEGFMAGIGLMTAGIILTAALALMVYYLNWWALPAAASIVGLGLCFRSWLHG